MKCFVTKLPVSVDNDSLDFFGYARVDVNTTVNTKVNINSSVVPLDAFIVGDGYFTNNNGDNLGKKCTQSSDEAMMSKGTYKLYVSKKTTFTWDLCHDNGDSTSVEAHQLNGVLTFPNFNSSVRKLTGDLADVTIPFPSALIELAYNSKFKGTIEDIVRLFPSAITIVLEGDQQLTGDFSCLLNADQSALKLPSLKTLNIRFIDQFTRQTAIIDKLKSLGVTITM